MAQTTILAPDTTDATSTDVVIAAGAFATVGIFSVVTGRVPFDALRIMQVTPGAANEVDPLNDARRSVVLVGPGTFRVVRTAYSGTAFGAFLDA